MPEPSNVTPATSGSQVRDTAESAAQGMKERMTSTLGSVADKARQVAADAPGAVSDLGDAAVDRMGQASDYVRNIDLKDVWADVVKLVKARPAESVVAAVALGVLVGRLGARRM